MGVRVRGIPTKYGGIRYRSKLEVQYAKFADALGVKFSYEPLRWSVPLVDGGTYSYLPDFWIIGRDFLEIKGHLNQDNIWKAQGAQKAYRGVIELDILVGRVEFQEVDDLARIFGAGLPEVRRAVETVSGYGTEECKKCNGAGEVSGPCGKCDGSGDYPHDSDCSHCSGECFGCDGLGYWSGVCSYCKGRGFFGR